MEKPPPPRPTLPGKSPDLDSTPAPERRPSASDLIRLGEQALTKRLTEQALQARARHGGLTPANLDAFLLDTDCVRYPTRLLFEVGTMGPHQFAQPEPDPSQPDGAARLLRLRPALRSYPDLLPLAVAYFVPVINYGDVVADEHCLLYGAILLGLEPDEFYRKVCELADLAGAQPLVETKWRMPEMGEQVQEGGSSP